MSVWSELRAALGRPAVERDVAEELEAHILHRVDELVASGWQEDEARRRAEEEFGDLGRIRAECTIDRLRERRRSEVPAFLDTLRQDVAYALRQIRRSPGFAFVAVLTLALGIGATTTIVGVVRAVVLAPLPFEDADRVVFVGETTPAGDPFSVAEANYLDWRDRASSFTELAATTERSTTWTGNGVPRSLRAAWVSASFLDVLGVRPVLGRGIAPDEDAPGGRRPVAVLGNRLWRSEFGADPDVVGRTLVLDGIAHAVVGVLPPDLLILDRADLLVPLGADPTADRENHYLDVIGRLAPGVGLEAARSEMSALASAISGTHRDIAGWGAEVQPARDVLLGPALERAGWVLLGAAALLLLIACVNVSNLLLARASARRAEVGVRLALGAGRGRMVRQLLTESLVLSLLGGGAGLLLTLGALPAVRAVGGGRIPRLDQAAFSPGVLATCFAAVLVAAVAFGLAPSLDLRRRASADALRAARRTDAGRGGGTRSGMVVVQIALSVMLLLGTGLLVRSFVRLAGTDPGFDPDGTLTLGVFMPDRVYDPEQRVVLLHEVLTAVRDVPGVASAGATVVDPFGGMNLANFTAREDRMPADRRDFLPIAWRVVTPGFFAAMGMDLLDGRSFRDDDGGAGGFNVVVGAGLAKRLWPEGGAVGGTLVWGDPDGSRMTVVGVVGDLRDVDPARPAPPIIYVPHREIPWSVMTLVVRAGDVTPAVGRAIRAAVHEAAPGLAVPEMRSLRDNVREAMAEPRLNTLLLGTFATAGLLLALVGVYGVTSFMVSRRVREIGIRLALGGEPSAIRAMVLAQSLRLALWGVALGAGSAWLSARWVASLLYETEPHDPVTWAVVPLVLLGATVAAAYLPARRATRVEPRDALAGE